MHSSCVAASSTYCLPPGQICTRALINPVLAVRVIVPVYHCVFIFPCRPSLFGFDAEVSAKHMRRRGGFSTLERDHKKNSSVHISRS